LKKARTSDQGKKRMEKKGAQEGLGVKAAHICGTKILPVMGGGGLTNQSKKKTLLGN